MIAHFPEGPGPQNAVDANNMLKNIEKIIITIA